MNNPIRTEEYTINKLYIYDGQYFPALICVADYLGIKYNTLKSKVFRSKDSNRTVINNKELIIKCFYSVR